ncbi:MAG: Glycosyl transferase, family 2 [Candidatus Woesebacteria bacterium GW2011_GWB1_43_14]|uniref:Glycosyl transferase, family 2 n=1 Tax=Candidatus Woesebacteria bacterium GW2011_GWB1_43_14 TaxID=1618578 RepID=A0A0G1FQD8_9BACT|nr:MAG: Glycosyl transferase, family 2 [Candidatus Woesebacteria bacterium GW2011_GWA1_39_11b]KKS78341.1 MAG: Glycosyl transferase, family 2 [Candidatus Woesebacteria bacterium GW2011_GWC1_42_9]KKS97241.1 MAG: Glycosyl transferase, family 2 [Candidatus Woesebacteria bacterium GW2011_GWB1_43_14]
MKLSVVLATKNEEENIGDCLRSVRGIADEIIIYDEYSTDKTREIAKKYEAHVFKWRHQKNFHETKQRALRKAKGEWILQLDADERVGKSLSDEISRIINLNHKQIRSREIPREKRRLFEKHQKLVEERDGGIGKVTGEVVAFFIPRVNYFLGKPLIHAGVYPDGVIRLVKNGKAHFPAKSVHEQIVIDGEVAWLMGDLEHHDSPTLSRYLFRLNRYTDLRASDFANSKLPKNIFFLLFYSTLKPFFVFLKLFIRHRGYKDGIRGFLWSMFSSMHYPIAYYKYWSI